MLRSRIDEQSQLIMILKSRADEAFSRTSTLERINKELTEFRDNAKENLDHEIRKFNLLDRRFNDLASNHEEMIKYKDEYKRVNVELRQENERLKDENARLFSKAIVEKDDKIRLLEGKLASVKDQYASLETKYRYVINKNISSLSITFCKFISVLCLVFYLPAIADFRNQELLFVWGGISTQGLSSCNFERP